MSERTPLPELSEEQAAQVEHSIKQGFAFLRDVLRQPAITEEIPSGSTLAFYVLTLPGDRQPVRLTAFQPKGLKRWGVRVTGMGDVAAPALPMARWLLAIAPLMEQASWASADEAFAAVEESLQRATELHLLAG
jgi:hypothetical protein